MLIRLISRPSFIETSQAKISNFQTSYAHRISVGKMHCSEWNRRSFFSKKIVSLQSVKQIRRSIWFGLIGGSLTSYAACEITHAMGGEILTTPLSVKVLIEEGLFVSNRYAELVGNAVLYPETGMVNFIYELKLGLRALEQHREYALIIFKLMDKDGNLLGAFNVPHALQGKGEQVFSFDKEILRRTTNVITSIYSYSSRVWVDK